MEDEDEIELPKWPYEMVKMTFVEVPPQPPSWAFEEED